MFVLLPLVFVCVFVSSATRGFDIKSNISILNAAKELQNFLNYKQARSVEIKYLPYEGHEKKGIDDYFADLIKGKL